jgi:hypothetical protein
VRPAALPVLCTADSGRGYFMGRLLSDQAGWSDASASQRRRVSAAMISVIVCWYGIGAWRMTRDA